MHPEQFAPIVILIFVLLVIAAAIKIFLGKGSAGDFPYERKDPLFSAAERSFLGVLEDIFRNEYRILGKVRVADIIRPRKGLSPSARTSALNRITSKHVDFAVCDPKTLEVLGVIELDDSSHGEEKRQRRDKFLDSALTSAGVPFVRIPAQRAYTPADVRAEVSVLFDGKA